MSFRIRNYQPADRDALYRVALLTGDHGADATGQYRDESLLGHRYVGPYLDLAPELAFTLLDETGPCGYVLGAADTVSFEEAFLHDWLPPVLESLVPPEEDPATWDADQRLLAELFRPTFAHPMQLDRFPAHLHIDLLPRAQGQGQGRRMIRVLEDALTAIGVPGVHLGVSPLNSRAIGFYEALGYEPLAPRLPYEGVLLMGRALP